MGAVVEDLRQSPVGALVDRLYDAAPEPDLLTQAAYGFAKIFRADQAAVYVSQNSFRVRQRGLLLAKTPFHAKCDETDPASEARSEILDFLFQMTQQIQIVRLKGDKEWPPRLILLLTLSEERRLAIVAFRQEEFSQDDETVAASLSPDLKRAFNLHLRFLEARCGILGQQLFEDTTIAMFLTRQRVVEQANGQAKNLLKSGTAVITKGNVLAFEDPRAQAAFEALSNDDLPEDEQRLNTTFAGIVVGSLGEAWLVQLSRLKFAAGIAASFLSSTPVLIAITQFDTASSSRRLPLAGFTDLTTIERGILFDIVDGLDVSQISARMGRSTETTRWHVKRMFAKLGVSSQADLARLGSLLLPIAS